MHPSENINLVASQNILSSINLNQPFNIPVELLQIPDIKIVSINIDPDGAVIMNIESLIVETTCHKCGKKVTKKDGKEKARLLRHLPMFSNKTYIRIAPQSYKCNCGCTTVQSYPWHTPKASCTSIYEDHLLLQVINSTLSDVSMKEDIGYDTLRGIIDRKIDTSPDWTHIKKLKLLVSTR